MEKAKILEQLIAEAGYNLKSFSEKCGIPYTTLYGIIKNGVGKAGVDNIILICKNLGITTEKLEELASGKEKVEDVKPVLQGPYFNFAAEMQKKKISKNDMDKLWEFYKMINGKNNN